MKLEEQIQAYQENLDAVEKEAKLLLMRIKKARQEIKNIHTEEDARAFSDENNLQEGFEIIDLW